jgi:uncharacterized protein (TIGR02271 family)
MTRRDEPTEQQRLPASEREADAVVTRSEEELRITTHRRETQRARLVRFVETETVTRTVEVRHDQVRIEYADIPAGDAAGQFTASADGGEGWMVLYDEVVVVTTRRVPRERVRLRTHSVTQDHEISEVLSKEQIEIDDGEPGP